MSADILWTSWDQCRSTVQYSFTSTETTRRLVRTDNPGRPPRLSQLLNYDTFCCCWSLLYSAILRPRAHLLRLHVILHVWLAFFIARFWISTEVVYLQRWHGWCHMKLLPSRRVLCTPQNHASCHSMSRHFRNKSQHGQLTIEKKILPPLLQGIRTRDLSVTSQAL